jgi:3-isopropylmalate dehydrogenase
MEAKIVLLPGDGIGPEVIEQAGLVLEAVAADSGHTFNFEEQPIGGTAIDQTGDPLPQSSMEACRSADAVLLGAVGGPKWSDPQAPVRPEQGLLRLRSELGLYANLRPIRPLPGAASASPLRCELIGNVDILIVRELTGGLYYAQPTVGGVRLTHWPTPRMRSGA